jgi:hypothetical protein
LEYAGLVLAAKLTISTCPVGSISENGNWNRFSHSIISGYNVPLPSF